MSQRIHSPTPESQINRNTFDRGLVKSLPRLRAYARRLTQDPSRADDLVQETMAKALRSRNSYRRDDNQAAWLSRILKNTFLSDLRRARFETGLENVPEPRVPGGLPAQEAAVRLADAEQAIAALPKKQRQALLLVGAGELSYEEAAARCDCPAGTIKSRVSRARREVAAAA